MDPQLGYSSYLLFLGILAAGCVWGWLKVREEVKNDAETDKKMSSYGGHKWQRNFLDDIIDPKG